MSSATGLVIRRGAEALSAQLKHRDEFHTSKPAGLTASIFLFTLLTMIVLMIITVFVAYPCDYVAITLAAVEDSNPSLYTKLGNHDSTDSFDMSDPEDSLESVAGPITTSLRSTLKYLRSRGGFWSYFRGFRYFLAFMGATGGTTFLFGFIPLPGSPSFGHYIRWFASSLLFATWEMTWIHMILANKSPKTNYRRLPRFRHLLKIAPAAALYYAMFCLLASPIHTASNLPFKLSPGSTAGETYRTVSSLLATHARIGVLSAISDVVCLPARVIFIRVTASMLPEEAEPIVEFDRTFGGKVKSEAMGGSGKLSLKDAWTTWDWPARIRCMKMALKAIAIECSLGAMAYLLPFGLLVLYVTF